MNETKFADSGEEESLGRFAQYIDYPKEMPFPNMRFDCGGPGRWGNAKTHLRDSATTFWMHTKTRVMPNE